MISKVVVITQGGIEYTLDIGTEQEYTDAEYRQVVTDLTILYSHYPAFDKKGREVLLPEGFLKTCVYRHDIVEI